MRSLLAIIPLGAVDSVNVLAVLAVIYVWVSSSGRAEYARTALAYVVGGIIGLTLTLLFSFTFIVAWVREALDAISGTLAGVIGLLLAAVLLWLAVQTYRSPPMSLPVHRQVHPSLAFVLGIATWGIQSLTSAPFYAAIAVMAPLDGWHRLLNAVVFVIIALGPVLTLVGALALVSHDLGQRIVARVEEALPRASKAVSIVLGAAAVVGAGFALAVIVS